MSASMSLLGFLTKSSLKKSYLISCVKANAEEAAESLTIIKDGFCSCINVKSQVNQ